MFLEYSKYCPPFWWNTKLKIHTYSITYSISHTISHQLELFWDKLHNHCLLCNWICIFREYPPNSCNYKLPELSLSSFRSDNDHTLCLDLFLYLAELLYQKSISKVILAFKYSFYGCTYVSIYHTQAISGYLAFITLCLIGWGITLHMLPLWDK